MDEDEPIDYSVYSLGELQEIIGKMEDEPVDKRKKEYKEYKKIVNLIMDIYNKKAGIKIYAKIK